MVKNKNKNLVNFLITNIHRLSNIALLRNDQSRYKIYEINNAV